MTVLKRIGASLLGVLLLAYIVYHALVVPYTSIKTETAVSFSAKKTVSVTESYIIRNEHLVASEHQGVFSYTVANGSKVANGGAIASVYGSHEAAQAKVKLDDLDRQIEALETLQGMGSNIVVSVDQIEKQLQSALIDTLNGSSDGDYSTLKENSEAYLTLLNRRLAVTDSSVDFSARIASLKSQRDSLSAAAGQVIGTVQFRHFCHGLIQRFPGAEHRIDAAAQGHIGRDLSVFIQNDAFRIGTSCVASAKIFHRVSSFTKTGHRR